MLGKLPSGPDIFFLQLELFILLTVNIRWETDSMIEIVAAILCGSSLCRCLCFLQENLRDENRAERIVIHVQIQH